MLDIGVQELLVILVIALLVFGPEQLPELGRRLGRAMREFRRASDEFRRTVETNLNLDLDGQPPLPPSASDWTPSPPVESAPAAGDQAASDPTARGSPTTLMDGMATDPVVPVNGDGSEGVVSPLEPFWTTRGGRLLHRADCGWRKRVSADERIAVKTAGEGWDQGLQACPVCDPRAVEVPS